MHASTGSPETRRAFARAYPFALSDTSFVMSGGRKRDWDVSESELHRRTPVLAVGSNQSPEQIARKFPEIAAGEVPVLRVALEGFDSVYSAHITQYASIPATLAVSPGTTVHLCVTWLTDDQVLRMHETEIPGENYSFARLDGLTCTPQHGPTLRTVFAYVSTRGHVAEAGVPIPLAEIAAENRLWPAKSQPAMQDWLAGHLTDHGSSDTWIDAHLSEPTARVQSMQAMQSLATPFSYAGLTRVEV